MICQSTDYFNCLIEHLWSDPKMRGAPMLPVLFSDIVTMGCYV